MSRRPTARILSLLPQLVLVAVFALVWIFLRDKIPLHNLLQRAEEQIATWGVPGILAFPLIYGLCNILLLPAGILTLGGGYFFGFWGGFLLVLIGNLLGALGAMLISRTLLRGWIERQLLRRPRLAAVDAALQREGPKIIFFTQLNPLFPTSLLNYLYGLTAIPLPRCLACIALGQAPGLLLYAYLGAVGHRSLQALQNGSGGSDPYTLLLFAAILLSLVITLLLGRLCEKIVGDSLRPVPPPVALVNLEKNLPAE